MQHRPRVSVIIIFHNAERFLSEAIESVFGQTYENWELLLVDDGSTDRSTELARQGRERDPGKVRLLEHEGRRNLGMSASRNLGIREAQAEFIAFLDADDTWLPRKLELQVAGLESHPEAAMVYGPTHYWFSWTGDPEDRQRDFVSPLGPAPDTLVKPPALFTICHPLGEAPSPIPTSLMVRRSLLETIGGFEDSFRGLYEDQAFLVKVYLHGTIFVSGDCLTKYRMHPDSCVFRAMRTGQSNRARKIFLNWLEGYLKTQQVQDEAIWRALGQARRLCLYPALTKWVASGRRFLTRARYKWLRATRWAGKRTALIEAHPNPIPVSGSSADRFPIGTTTLSWTAGSETEVEVHVDSPDGPLLSRTAGCGTITTGLWVCDGMTFFLQDVSNGKPLTAENTLDVAVVRVVKPR